MFQLEVNKKSAHCREGLVHVFSRSIHTLDPPAFASLMIAICTTAPFPDGLCHGRHLSLSSSLLYRATFLLRLGNCRIIIRKRAALECIMIRRHVRQVAVRQGIHQQVDIGSYCCCIDGIPSRVHCSKAGQIVRSQRRTCTHQ